LRALSLATRSANGGLEGAGAAFAEWQRTFFAGRGARLCSTATLGVTENPCRLVSARGLTRDFCDIRDLAAVQDEESRTQRCPVQATHDETQSLSSYAAARSDPPYGVVRGYRSKREQRCKSVHLLTVFAANLDAVFRHQPPENVPILDAQRSPGWLDEAIVTLECLLNLGATERVPVDVKRV
jgi:hypothetical protein